MMADSNHAPRDVFDVLDQVAQLVPPDDVFRTSQLAWLKKHLEYQAPEVRWLEASERMVGVFERWRTAKAPWFKDVFSIWMNRPWQEGDPS